MIGLITKSNVSVKGIVLMLFKVLKEEQGLPRNSASGRVIQGIVDK